MKRVFAFSVMMLCAMLAMAQFAHAFTMDSASCDVIKAEQHLGAKVEAASSGYDAAPQDAQGSCCESCHIQLESFPITAADEAMAPGDPATAVLDSVHGVLAGTLSEPPQA